MSASTLPACQACGWQGRPRRIRCPRCTGTTWVNAPLPNATVMAITHVRRHLGVVVEPPEVICLVVTDDGTTFITRCEDSFEPTTGERVSLTFEYGVVAHRPRKSSRARSGAKRKLGP